MNLEQVKKRVREAYPDGQIEVADLTGAENHFEIKVRSSAFAGMSRIAQHRAIMDVFDVELKSGEVHALTIKTNLPGGNQ